MTIENKLGIDDTLKLAHEEERLTKKRALELYDKKILDSFEIGTFAGLKDIHGYLFQDVYPFAGKLRTVNIAKGHFRFAPVLYLEDALRNIDKMPQDTFEHIIEKYVEMNVAHPLGDVKLLVVILPSLLGDVKLLAGIEPSRFREGNGRSTRIWLDCILKNKLGKVVDWSKIDKEDYLFAMERSPVRNKEIMLLLKKKP